MAYSKYLQETGTAYFLLEDGSGVLLLDPLSDSAAIINRGADSPATPVSSQSPMGDGFLPRATVQRGKVKWPWQRKKPGGFFRGG